MKEGDKNTKMFHQKAVWRARKNKIKKLKDAEGIWKEDQTYMELMATYYFKDLFTRDMSLNPDALLSMTQEKVTPAMNADLCKDFTDDEIGDALFQIGPLKAPGVDGFPARFYQQNWGMIKEEEINAVKLFFVTGRMPEGMNDTAIILIAKIDQPETLKDFRPISLCTEGRGRRDDARRRGYVLQGGRLLRAQVGLQSHQQRRGGGGDRPEADGGWGRPGGRRAYADGGAGGASPARVGFGPRLWAHEPILVIEMAIIFYFISLGTYTMSNKKLILEYMKMFLNRR
jgi:hypothetical protein